MRIGHLRRSTNTYEIRHVNAFDIRTMFVGQHK